MWSQFHFLPWIIRMYHLLLDSLGYSSITPTSIGEMAPSFRGVLTAWLLVCPLPIFRYVHRSLTLIKILMFLMFPLNTLIYGVFSASLELPLFPLIAHMTVPLIFSQALLLPRDASTLLLLQRERLWTSTFLSLLLLGSFALRPRRPGLDNFLLRRRISP